jgi:hypothetical protein
LWETEGGSWSRGGAPNTDIVEAALADEAVCRAANWSEIAQKVHAANRGWDLAKALLESYELRIEPVTADAEWGTAGRIRQIR